MVGKNKILYKRNGRKNNPWQTNYQAAQQRCLNPRHHRYKSYGARGIKFLMTVEDFKKL